MGNNDGGGGGGERGAERGGGGFGRGGGLSGLARARNKGSSDRLAALAELGSP